MKSFSFLLKKNEKWFLVSEMYTSQIDQIDDVNRFHIFLRNFIGVQFNFQLYAKAELLGGVLATPHTTSALTISQWKENAAE